MTSGANEDGNELALLYQRIGEFAVSFQWLEGCIREIGWLLRDPNRVVWPPTELRNITNRDLLDRVGQLFRQTVGAFPGVGAASYCDSFDFVVQEAHRIRQTRNALLHSAFVELKAGDDIVGILRADTKLASGPEGEPLVASEVLTEAGVQARLASLVPVGMAFQMFHRQLIAWAPFDPRPRLDACGLAFHQVGLPFQEELSTPKGAG